MEFGRHIGKGLWAFGDKALPALYGIGMIFLVQRALPTQEYATLAVILQVFTLISALCTWLAYQPLVKFAAESENKGGYIVGAWTLSAVFYLLISGLLIVFKPYIVPLLDRTGKGNLGPLLSYVPWMFAATWYRSFAVGLLQASYKVVKIFWIDAAYFLGIILWILLARWAHHYSTGEDFLLLNILALLGSSFLAVILTFVDLRGKLRFEKKALGQMWDFGKFAFWGAAFYTLYSQMDVFFVSSFAGILAVAPYSVAKLFTRLFDMLAQVVQMFLIPFSSKASSQENIEKLRATAEKAICFSTLIFLPVFVVMFFFPGPLLHLLYGGKFDSAATTMRVFSFLALIIPWNAVAAAYIVGMGKVKDSFYITIGMVICAFVAYAALTPRLGGVGAASGLVIVFFGVTAYTVHYLNRFVPIRITGVAKRVIDVRLFLERRGKTAG
ncbi:MAG TPA: oligosaccharide flippase family protein [Bacteroidota bacterium]|nr:oligosaccharide flippase family protein [Bacteroidota bacterium]